MNPAILAHSIHRRNGLWFFLAVFPEEAGYLFTGRPFSLFIPIYKRRRAPVQVLFFVSVFLGTAMILSALRFFLRSCPLLPAAEVIAGLCAFLSRHSGRRQKRDFAEKYSRRFGESAAQKSRPARGGSIVQRCGSNAVSQVVRSNPYSD